MPRISASEAFVETLVAHGVKDVFGIVGSAYMDALDLFPGAGIRFISVAHEQNAAHMADGYSRVSDRHGVCIGQNGPGITNFVTAIAAAYWAHSPVVAITPETGSMGMGLGGFQETDQLPIFSKITKYQAHVSSPERIAELTHRAFSIAQLERGPTQVNIPRDHFYGEFDAEIAVPKPIERSAGGAASLEAAAELLANAKFPVVMAGGGVVMSGGCAEAVALAEWLGAPVITSYLHNDAFPASHPLLCGPIGYQGSKAAMRIVEQADVVLALGSRLGPFGTLPQYGMEYWPESAKIIQVDSDARSLGLVRPFEVAICGDARAAAADLLRRLESPDRKAPVLDGADARRKEVEAQKQSWERELDEMSSGDGTPIPPRRCLRELEKAMPTDAIVATDIGNICSISNSYLRFERPNSFLAAMSFGNCGYAFPTAMGAKVAAPDRPCVAYVGDGAWGMSLTEVMTCVRENIPVTAVVFNNGQWGAEKRNQIDFYDDRFLGVNLENPSFAEIARSMGAQGVRVDAPDQIGDALREATASDRATVLEIMVTQELGDPFRRDALKKPKRLLAKYKDFGAAD
ncbi:MAG: sulfoacetaldehyde acetyltransferase [Deltaproteobacteria bacterium]|nr:sulfoacetaldehyde acetyltransferase [Deltaproteobacteria bacterium]MBW2290751.1 sulfoacetaldehyde acetyltransferase [Deltaproteobacteria bacterium]MBW2391102.1 sulfoacetaldehyde acetyltransferase [Deltaproteobacteria bacterium]MBW2724136.1 sulfoacetaldehyde acetyltransferase [Deltaproteobacteria bacterium]